ncbi:MAG TPA: Fe-S protein assembly co-chaperone HscB [Vicinamibacterales bacterium]
MITARPKDYFSFLDLPRKLNIDMADLEKRFRALSRQFHPDYFVNAPAADRRQSLEQSSYLNDAYRTLKNPSARLEYLLGLEGLALKGPQEMSKAVPPALLEEVFALNEELDDIRELRSAGASGEQWKPRLERARAPIDAKRDEHEAQLRILSDRWDALVDAGRENAEGQATLTALRERMLERSYINNLLAGIERELTT